MALLSPRLGAKAVISIGRKGDVPDLYPAIMVSAPETVPVPGRNFLQRVAEFIYVAMNQTTGEPYLARKTHGLNFSFDRTLGTLNALGISDVEVARLIHSDLLDGAPDAPKSWQEVATEQGVSATRFALNRTPVANIESVNVADLMADEAEQA